MVATPATATTTTTTTKERGCANSRGDDSNIPLCSLALGPPMTAVDWRRKLTSALPSSMKQRRLQQQDIVNTTSLVSTYIAPGWQVLDNRILRATGNGTRLSLHVIFVVDQQQQDEPRQEKQQQQQQQRMRAILFVVHQKITVRPPTINFGPASAAPTILEWATHTENKKTRWTRQVITAGAITRTPIVDIAAFSYAGYWINQQPSWLQPVRRRLSSLSS
jgi:hypothetical protein